MESTIEISEPMITKYMDNHHTYVCKFEKLITNPAKEAQQLETFLNLKDHHPFSPKPTQNVQFTEQERVKILDETDAERKIFAYHRDHGFVTVR